MTFNLRCDVRADDASYACGRDRRGLIGKRAVTGAAGGAAPNAAAGRGDPGGKRVSMLPFILFTVLTNAAAQLMLKNGILSLGALDVLHGNVVSKLLHVVLHPWVFAGLLMFVISTCSHLYVLSKVQLSFAYPFLSLAYVAVAVAAWFWFDENLNALRVAGIALICLGTALIAQGGDARDPSAGPAEHVLDAAPGAVEPGSARS